MHKRITIYDDSKQLDWIDADNNTITITIGDLREALELAIDKQNSLWTSQMSDSIIQLCSLASMGIMGWAYIKFTVAQHSKELEDHRRRIDAGFKRIDHLNDRILTLENREKELLDNEKAKLEYITRIELELKLELLKKEI